MSELSVCAMVFINSRVVLTMMGPLDVMGREGGCRGKGEEGKGWGSWGRVLTDVYAQYRIF